MRNLRSRDNLSVLEPSDPGLLSTRDFRVLTFCSASVKSKFNTFVVSLDILDSYFHSPDLNRGTVNSGCVRKSPPATCSSGSREGMIVSERERKRFACRLGSRTEFLDQRLCWRTRFRTQCLESSARILLRCPVTRASRFSEICGASAWVPRSVRVRVTCDIASSWPVQ